MFVPQQSEDRRLNYAYILDHHEMTKQHANPQTYLDTVSSIQPCSQKRLHVAVCPTATS